jgi:hypothetical protein
MVWTYLADYLSSDKWTAQKHFHAISWIIECNVASTHSLNSKGIGHLLPCYAGLRSRLSCKTTIKQQILQRSRTETYNLSKSSSKS